MYTVEETQDILAYCRAMKPFLDELRDDYKELLDSADTLDAIKINLEPLFCRSRSHTLKEILKTDPASEKIVKPFETRIRKALLQNHQELTIRQIKELVSTFCIEIAQTLLPLLHEGTYEQQRCKELIHTPVPAALRLFHTSALLETCNNQAANPVQLTRVMLLTSPAMTGHARRISMSNGSEDNSLPASLEEKTFVQKIQALFFQ